MVVGFMHKPLKDILIRPINAYRALSRYHFKTKQEDLSACVEKKLRNRSSGFKIEQRNVSQTKAFKHL